MHIRLPSPRWRSAFGGSLTSITFANKWSTDRLVAAPHIWNRLPTDVVARCKFTVNFSSTIKTFFFYSGNHTLISFRLINITQSVNLAVTVALYHLGATLKTDWLIDWLIDWLTHWLIAYISSYQCTKFDYSSFSRSRDMVDAHQNLNVHVTWLRPCQRWVVVRGLRLAILSTSLANLKPLSRLTRKIWKGIQKCRKWGGFG